MTAFSYYFFRLTICIKTEDQVHQATQLPYQRQYASNEQMCKDEVEQRSSSSLFLVCSFTGFRVTTFQASKHCPIWLQYNLAILSSYILVASAPNLQPLRSAKEIASFGFTSSGIMPIWYRSQCFRRHSPPACCKFACSINIDSGGLMTSYILSVLAGLTFTSSV